MLGTLFSVAKGIREHGASSALDQILAVQDRKMQNLTTVHYPSENAEPRHTFTSNAG